MKSNKKDKQKELISLVDVFFSAFTGVLIALGSLAFWSLLGASIDGFHLFLSLLFGCAYAIMDFVNIKERRELRELKLKGGKK